MNKERGVPGGGEAGRFLGFLGPGFGRVGGRVWGRGAVGGLGRVRGGRGGVGWGVRGVLVAYGGPE